MNLRSSCFQVICVLIFALSNSTINASDKENAKQQNVFPRARGAKEEKPLPDWTLQHDHFALDLSDIYKINKNNLAFLAERIKKSGIDVSVKNAAGLTLRDIAEQTNQKYSKSFQLKASKKFSNEWKMLMDALSKKVECKKVLGENNGNKKNMH
jgi:hypothetical protein